jgi:hypothetical protein
LSTGRRGRPAGLRRNHAGLAAMILAMSRI